MAVGIVTTMKNAEDRILRVWTPTLLRTILASAATLVTLGLLVSVMHSSSNHSSALRAIQENSAAPHRTATSLLTEGAHWRRPRNRDARAVRINADTARPRQFLFYPFLKEMSFIFVTFTAYLLAGQVVGILLWRIGERD
jgi:hypothetical protein